MAFTTYQSTTDKPDKTYQLEEELKPKYSRLNAVLFVLSFMAMAGLTLFAFTISPSIEKALEVNSKHSALYSTAATIVVDLTLSNSYDNPSSLSMLPWDFITEPHRENTFKLSRFEISDVEYDADDATSVTWTIADETYSGSEVVVLLTSTGVYNCTVVVKYDDGSYIKSFTVANKYIRREIRDLSDSDLTTFFDALKTLYEVNQSVGEALYGSKYASAEMLTWYHLNGAGRTDCDHWHDGAGIVTHHAAFTLQAEQSLQSINATIAMPYWEYPYVSLLLS